MTNPASEVLMTALSEVAKAATQVDKLGVSPSQTIKLIHVSTLREIEAIIRTEKLRLLDELDKSMPTDEQLTTKYGYYMPEKQYGYRLGLHDIRETIEAERNKLKERYQ